MVIMTTSAIPQTAAPKTATSSWNLDPVHSVAEFKVKHMMISNVKGQFANVGGVLTLDEGDPTNSRIEASIEVGRQKRCCAGAEKESARWDRRSRQRPASGGLRRGHDRGASFLARKPAQARSTRPRAHMPERCLRGGPATSPAGPPRPWARRRNSGDLQRVGEAARYRRVCAPRPRS